MFVHVNTAQSYGTTKHKVRHQWRLIFRHELSYVGRKFASWIRVWTGTWAFVCVTYHQKSSYSLPLSQNPPPLRCCHEMDSYVDKTLKSEKILRSSSLGLLGWDAV